MDEAHFRDTNNENFQCAIAYWGEIGAAIADRTRVYGFENVTTSRPLSANLPSEGTSYGFVESGAVLVSDEHGDVPLGPGQWFAIPNECKLREFAPNTRVVISWSHGFHGLRAFGGPIENLGRLKYIDRCSDTLLAAPAMSGDPCLNHLHFPVGIEQTEHTHPSVRCGIIARGHGTCETPDGLAPLFPGLVFLIPAGGLHKFVTTDDSMDVIAFHPDSDWGPTDEEHPMVNRTLVDGAKIDNSTGVHSEAEVVGR